MTIDPLLVRIVDTLLEELGELGAREREGVFAAPIESWDNRRVIDFIDHMRQATGDEYMGLGATPCTAGASDFIIELGTRCETLREAILMGFRFMKMVTGAFHFELSEADDLATLVIRQEPSPRDPANVLSDWAMISWHKLAQWLIGAEIWLERTEFAHPLHQDYADYAAMFGSNCSFSTDACRLVFARSNLDRRVVRMPTEGDRMKATTPGYFSQPGLISQSWKQLIRTLLRSEIAKGHPPLTIEQLADEFGVSSQTLRRRLRAEGISYRDLKAEARLEVARHMLVDRQVTLSEASIAAGFAEPNALSRALRTSRGMSARELRRQVLGSEDGEPERE